MREVTITLRRQKGRGYFADPIGWKIEGVIAPVVARWWRRASALLCATAGLIVVPRDHAGFAAAAVIAGLGGHPTVGADDIQELAAAMRGPALVYSVHEISAVIVRSRSLKHQVRFHLRTGDDLTYHVFARDAINDYRSLLDQTYGAIYSSEAEAALW